MIFFGSHLGIFFCVVVDFFGSNLRGVFMFRRNIESFFGLIPSFLLIIGLVILSILEN